MKNSTAQIKVGLFALVALVVIGIMNVRLSKSPSVLGATDKYYFYVPDASGLINNAAVKVAGVKVGIIDDISLHEGRARIDIVIQGDLDLTTDAAVELVSNGILGDKFVSIVGGDPTADPLESGTEIKRVISAGSLNDVMSEVSKVSSALQDVAMALKQATVDGTDATPIGRIVENLERLTNDFADIASANKGKINNVVDSIEELTETLKVALGEDQRDEFKQGWGHVLDGMERFDRSLANIEEVTGKVKEGEGTIGRLLHDETTVEGINKAIYNLNRVLGGALTLRTTFDYHSEFMMDREDIQSYVGLKIQPGLDRYYYFGIVQDPFGVTKSSVINQTTTTVSNPAAPTDGTEVLVREKEETDKNAIKFTALFAKNFYNLTVKGGLIQSSGGFGFDYYLLNQKLRLSMEMFDFDDPNLRVFARWTPYKGVYLVGGGDSILQREERDFNPFIGGGITITNDDLNIFAAQFFR